MAEYIKRDDAVCAIREFSKTAVGIATEALVWAENVILDIVPSADVQPVVHGEWIEKEIFYDENADIISDWQSARCSVCNTYHTTPYSYYFTDYNFCPNCGARMDGKDINVATNEDCGT